MCARRRGQHSTRCPQGFAGYLAKYATKSIEATGHNSIRITADTIDQHADPDGSHTAA
jgi:hypothetical protein